MLFSSHLPYDPSLPRELEELEALKAYDAAKSTPDDAVPLDQALAEIEKDREWPALLRISIDCCDLGEVLRLHRFLSLMGEDGLHRLVLHIFIAAVFPEQNFKR